MQTSPELSVGSWLQHLGQACGVVAPWQSAGVLGGRTLPTSCWHKFAPKQCVFHQPSAQAGDRKSDEKAKGKRKGELIRNAGCFISSSSGRWTGAGCQQPSRKSDLLITGDC